MAIDNPGKKAWNKLPVETRTAMLVGSSLVAAIYDNLDREAYVIIELMVEKFPDFSKAKMHEGLKPVVKILCAPETRNSLSKGFIDPDKETIIKLIQENLKGLEGKMWAIISYTIASIFAIAVDPAQTKVDKIASSMGYCYHTFVKEKNEKEGDE